jgi:hypothetical protein
MVFNDQIISRYASCNVPGVTLKIGEPRSEERDTPDKNESVDVEILRGDQEFPCVKGAAGGKTYSNLSGGVNTPPGSTERFFVGAAVRDPK